MTAIPSAHPSEKALLGKTFSLMEPAGVEPATFWVRFHPRALPFFVIRRGLWS
jgi:hypothetical protein